MAVRAFCIGLSMVVFIQLTHVQKVDAAFWIVPTSLQLFEYELISFKCSGFDVLSGPKVLRRTNSGIETCGFSKWGVSTELSCTIRGAFSEDSGEYWCEAGGGKRSNSVNIVVTAGSVVFEGPVLPLMEGEAATLSCRNKTTSSNLTASFYKDGRLIWSSSSSQMTIDTVSKCDEGLYKCSISGDGDSAESWLTVSALHSETRPPSSDHVFLILRNVLPLVLMAPLLLLLGLLHRGRLRGKHQQPTSTQVEMELT